MALKTDIRGMVWRYPDTYVVGREKVREFAKAIKAEDQASFNEKDAAELGYDALVAPLTFVSIFAQMVLQDFFRNVDVGLESMQLVQVDQKFVFRKPVLAGDTLNARMDVYSVHERFGADIVVTKNTCSNENGEVVLEAFTTVMCHEGDNSIQLKWDPKSGQVVRIA
jgi:acyl dehydratase